MKIKKSELTIYILAVLTGIILFLLTIEGAKYYFPNLDRRLAFILTFSVISIIETLTLAYAKPWRNPDLSLGSEGMLDKNGIVIEKCSPIGRVRVANELWNATTIDGKTIMKGEEIIAKKYRRFKFNYSKKTT